MKILLVGALSWNPERLRALCQQGHELWGLWARSMPWDQGPYPALEGCVRCISLEDAARTIREREIDVVYSLFQSYDPRLFAPARDGVEHDVWTLLRALLLERAGGSFDAPIVRHWGFDLHTLDPDVVRAIDGHVLCNRQKLDYLAAPAEQGGRGLEVFAELEQVDFLDGDLPPLAFMNDRFAEPLSDAHGELHTVCVGRPFGIDYAAAARRGIHVHVYSNSHDEALATIARDLRPRTPRADLELLRRHVHVHPSLQTIGASWDEIRAAKSRWVEEFSRYDAAWSYVGLPFPWEPLDDLAAIPNRLGTYMLAGLPVITDRRPGAYRYEELRRPGVAIELVDGDEDYEALREQLEAERRTRAKRARAREERRRWSFEATIEPLLASLERARESYFARPHAERTRFEGGARPRLVRLDTTAAVGRGGIAGSVRRAAWRRVVQPWRARRAAKSLRPRLDGSAE